MSSETKLANPPKCFSASLRGLLTAGTFTRRPIAVAMSLEGDALLGDGVIPTSVGTLLENETIEVRGVEPMHSGPAVAPVVQVDRGSIFSSEPDQRWNEVGITLAVHRWWQSYDRHAHTQRRDGVGRFFGCRARMPSGARRGRGLFGDAYTFRKDADGRGDDERPRRAGERCSKHLDGAPIQLAALFELREVMIESRVNDRFRRGGAVLEAVDIFDRPQLNLDADRLQRRDALVRVGKAQHLMSRAEQLLNDGGTDKSRGSSDKDTHDESPFG